MDNIEPSSPVKHGSFRLEPLKIPSLGSQDFGSRNIESENNRALELDTSKWTGIDEVVSDSGCDDLFLQLQLVQQSPSAL